MAKTTKTPKFITVTLFKVEDVFGNVTDYEESYEHTLNTSTIADVFIDNDFYTVIGRNDGSCFYVENDYDIVVQKLGAENA